MITKEQVEQWSGDAGFWTKDWVATAVLEVAQRAAAHGAAERERELMAVGMEPHMTAFKFGTPYASYTATQLAAARLQGAEEERKRAEQDLKARIKKTAEFFGSMHGNAEDAYIEQEAAHGIGVKEQTT